jgi:uncharacterized membrane protein YqhA
VVGSASVTGAWYVDGRRHLPDVGAGDGGPVVPAGRSRIDHDGAVQALLERSRFVSALAAIASMLLSIVTMVWAVAKGVLFVGDLLRDGAWRSAEPIGELLIVIDLLLVAITLLLVGLGLWELFVSDLELPEWLVFHDLGSLKVKIGELLILVLAIKFLELLVSKTPALDLLYYALAVSVVMAVLIAFITLRAERK